MGCDWGDGPKANGASLACQELGIAIVLERAAKVGDANQKQGVLEYIFKAKRTASKTCYRANLGSHKGLWRFSDGYTTRCGLCTRNNLCDIPCNCATLLVLPKLLPR